MKKITIIALAVFSLQACDKKQTEGKFDVTGEIKNAPDQKVFLDQFSFSQKDPEVVDTAELKNGKFKLESISPEQAMFRVRLEKQPQGYIFINDQPKINFKADANDMSLEGPEFSTAANSSLKQFLKELSTAGTALHEMSQRIDSLSKLNVNDSIVTALRGEAEQKQKSFETYAAKFADTTKSPVLAMFVLGYIQNMESGKLTDLITKISKRFPEHQGVSSLVLQYNQMLEEQKRRADMAAKIPGVGAMAPDFTLADPSGKPFTLSSLRGKYVLVDFWASWCGPCRGENPNVVAAYKQYKDKNFTVLGVSLDEDKAAWQKAIMQDGLSWQHVSDLKGWQSMVVGLYGFEGIPYNVLLDPQGKIIATSLRENALQQKLAEVLK
jgi:peroxiredoxin